MRILHINNQGTGTIYNQVVLPFMDALELHGAQNVFFSPDTINKEKVASRLKISLYNFSIFLKKTLRKFITKEDYFFYNIFENFSAFNTDDIIKDTCPDIIIVYWVTGVINAKLLKKLEKATAAKIYWYLMDEAPLTGGCHYSWGCDGYYAKACRSCPAMKLSALSIISASNFKTKNENIAQTNLTVIAATSELKKQIGRSIIFREKKSIQLLLGLNRNKYYPLAIDTITINNTSLIRQQEKIYALIGSNLIEDRRKGVQYFIEALHIINNKIPDLHNRLEIIVIGNARNNIFDEQKLNVNTINIGYVNEADLIKLYQFSDVLISPSIEDAGPLMVNQSIACGTPVLAFDVGIVRDLIVNYITGFKAERANADHLAEGLSYFIGLSLEEKNMLSKNCVRMADSSLNINTQAKLFLENVE